MRSRRGSIILSLVAVALAELVLVAPRAAHAVEPVTVGIFLEKGYALFKAGMALLGGPDLEQVKAEIIAEIQKTRLWELQGRVDSLVARFAENARNPDLMYTPGRIENFLDDTSDTFYEMQKIIWEGDVDQSYHLTSAYNVLSVLRVSAMAQLGYDDVSIHTVLSETLATNYQMVGARKAEFHLPWFGTLTVNTIRISKLWDSKMFAGYALIYWCPLNPHIGCSLITETCRRVISGGGLVSSEVTQACIGPAIARLTAQFDADTEVQVMRTALKQLVGMGANLSGPIRILEI